MAAAPIPPVSSLLVKDVVLYRALRLAQITRGPSRTANPEQINDALIALNGLIDSLNIQPEAIFSVDTQSFVLTPSKTVYTIGQDPQGVLHADFNAPRPIRIDAARLVLTSSPIPVYLPLKLLTAAEWSSIVVRQMPTTVPTMLYCDYDYPLASLYFWGYPTQANSVELWTWQPNTRFVTPSDWVISPPGYIEMYVYQLAVKLADQFGTALPPNVAAEARRLLGRVKALNSAAPAMGSADYGARSQSRAAGYGGSFNYLSGMMP